MSYDELVAIVDACLDDMWTLLPVEAVERISLRVVRLDRPERISVLEAILEEAEADYFWPILLEWWTDFEFPHTWKNLANRLRHVHELAPAYKFMPQIDQTFFDRLPKHVTIYRGASRKFPLGISWTTEKAKAEWFAHRFGDPDASVLSGTICKRHVWTVFTARNENEILCDPLEVRMNEVGPTS